MPLKSGGLCPVVSRLCRERGGAIAVIVAILLPVFVGGLALAIDLSRAWDLDTELQNAADASALGGASQLDGEAGARARAIQAAADSVLRLQANVQSFATDGSGTDIVIDDTVSCSDGSACVNPDITFYEDISVDPPVIATSDSSANYIQVTVQPRRVDYFFAGLVTAITEANPRAKATAFLGNVFCHLSPIMICNPFDDTTNPEFSLSVGGSPGPSWIGRAVKLDEGGAGASWTEGNFGLLSVEDAGADAVREAFANVNGTSICLGSLVETKTGQVTSIRQGMNTRFDLFNGKFSGEETNPDYFSSYNPVKGLKQKAGAGANDCADSNWEKGANPYTGRPDADVLADMNYVMGGGDPASAPNIPAPGARPELMGYPRDACLYNSSCPPTIFTGAADRFGIGIWDLALYMLVNHPANPSSPGPSPIANLIDFVNTSRGGSPAIGTGAGERPITREEVYRWEMDDMLTPADSTNTLPLEAGVYDNPRICSIPGDPPNGVDRRMLFVLVANCRSKVHDCKSGQSPEALNCSTVKGNTEDVLPAPGDGALAMHLTEPMGWFDTNNDLVGEIVGPVDPAIFAKVDSKYFVELIQGPGE